MDFDFEWVNGLLDRNDLKSFKLKQEDLSLITAFSLYLSFKFHVLGLLY